MITAYHAVLPLLKQAIESGSVRQSLLGKVIEPVFRKTSNFNMKPKPTR